VIFFKIGRVRHFLQVPETGCHTLYLRLLSGNRFWTDLDPNKLKYASIAYIRAFGRQLLAIRESLMLPK
jgi:hypothetical protein